MSETVFEEWGIVQKYGLYKGWYWWDTKKRKWSKDIDKFQEALKHFDKSNSQSNNCP